MNAARRLILAAALASPLASSAALALEPAGGSPEPARAVAHDADDPQDASVQAAAQGSTQEVPSEVAARNAGAQRSWLARGSDSALATTTESSGTSTGLTLGAVVIVLGLGAGAVALRFKRQKLAPLSPSESRLTVLSSSRVGPKAYAVTAHVGGRVLLLGVTDHSVTNLGWLDAPEPDVPAREQAEAESEPEPEGDELPDDYPGSALRASNPSGPLASSRALERFQEVLRGAVTSRAALPMRPSYAGRAPDPATLLGAHPTAGVPAAPPTAATAAPPAPAAAPLPVAASPLSLRRKRRGRDSFPPREPRALEPSRAPQAAAPSLEGQVAGLRSLRER
jgi:flagellar biogenesis protein FliO